MGMGGWGAPNRVLGRGQRGARGVACARSQVAACGQVTNPVVNGKVCKCKATKGWGNGQVGVNAWGNKVWHNP